VNEFRRMDTLSTSARSALRLAVGRPYNSNRDVLEKVLQPLLKRWESSRHPEQRVTPPERWLPKALKQFIKASKVSVARGGGFLLTEQVADYFGVNRETILRLVRRNQIPYANAGTGANLSV
jgi:excisionase family DNA binding protein